MFRGFQRDLIAPILAVNLIVYLIGLGLSAWSLGKYINGEQDHPHLGGNPSTSFVLIFALIAGVFGVSCVIVGLLHHRTWKNHTLALASSTAIISWAFTALAFGLICKQIILGGRRGKCLKTLEALIAISFLSQFLYVLLLHARILNHPYGQCFRNQDEDVGIAMPKQDHKTTTQPSDLQQTSIPQNFSPCPMCQTGSKLSTSECYKVGTTRSGLCSVLPYVEHDIVPLAL